VKLFEELCLCGYDMVPVNPYVAEVMGRRCFMNVQDIRPAPEAALLMTSPEVTEAVVRDCVQAGISRIWMYRASGKGAVNQKAVEFCREHGIKVIPGQCPLMFLPDSGTVHHVHGWLRRITGRYPRRAGAIAEVRAA